MEILIIGGLVVALMVYLSTKIKNEAKRAYERENFEAEGFTIVKPDDFIIPITEISDFAFEANSKDFGEDEGTEDFRQCRATVKIKEGIEPQTGSGEFDVQENEPLRIYHKALNNNELQKSYILEIAVLPEYEEKYLDGINLLLKSFSIK